MPRFIVKLETPHGPRYMEWSTIVDAPVTYGVTLEQFEAYYRERYGTEGMKELPDRLRRVAITGVSADGYASVAGLISCNRAGEDDTCMTLAQIIEHYCPRDMHDAGKAKRPRGQALASVSD